MDGQVEYTAGGQQWYQMGLADHTGAHREPQWSAVKNLNAQIKALSSDLANLAWENTFRSVAPAGSFITAVSDSFVQVGLFHSKDNTNDKYFYLVNRHCLPTDTLTVTVNISNAEPFFITDMLTGQPATGQLVAGTGVPFSYKLQPGEGRLFRIVPFTAQININQNSTYTNFRFVQADNPASSGLYTIDSIQVTQKYWVTATQQDSLAYAPPIQSHWETSSTGWWPYSPEAIGYLETSAQDSSNKFEVQYKIGGGKILTPKYSTQIFFNNVSPDNGSITINSNAIYTNSQTVNIKLSGSDAFPGLYQMRYAEKPFGNDSGYVNLVKNGCFEDTTDWIKQAANLDSGYAVISRSSILGVPQFEDYGNYIAQEVPMPKAGQLVRLKADLYGKIDEIPAIQVYGIYNDTLEPRIKYYLNKNIYDAEFLFTGNTVLNDTFTFVPPTDGTIAKMIVLIGYPGIMAVQVPALAASIPPQPVILHSNIYVDNICLEPVELKTGAQPDAIPPTGSYIYDGWDYADTNYSLNCQLSNSDGAKRVYMQLSDLAGNISFCPGWLDTIVLDMTKPLVGVVSPVNMSYVNSTISIRGYAWDIHFANWVLEFKKNNTETWTLLSNGISSIHYKFPQTLCLWNTETVNDGLYLLRQTGYDLAGNCKAETVYVYVANNTLPREAITADFAIFNSLPVDGTVDAFGNIYATDTQDDKIRKFSPEGDSLLCFGYKYTCTDTLGLNHPKGIAVDDSGNIWITDCYQSKVKKYDSAGNYLSTIGKHGNQQGEFNQPTGIAISGNEIYVVDHLNGRVQVFNKTGAFIRQFGNNCLNQPAGIAIRNNETEKLVYVCDSQNDRIAIFDTEGNLVNTLDSLGLDKPWDICFDNNNNLYIADVYHNRVIELDPWHNKLLTFGIQGQEVG
ncbi:MAG: NHL repeat-containing protein, partial [Planctomycetota bacterium]